MAMMQDPQQIKAAIAAYVGPMLRTFTDADLHDFRKLVTDQIDGELARRANEADNGIRT